MCSFRPYGSNLLRKGHGTDLVQFTHIYIYMGETPQSCTTGSFWVQHCQASFKAAQELNEWFQS